MPVRAWEHWRSKGAQPQSAELPSFWGNPWWLLTCRSVPFPWAQLLPRCRPDVPLSPATFELGTWGTLLDCIHTHSDWTSFQMQLGLHAVLSWGPLWGCGWVIATTKCIKNVSHGRSVGRAAWVLISEHVDMSRRSHFPCSRATCQGHRPYSWPVPHRTWYKFRQVALQSLRILDL